MGNRPCKLKIHTELDERPLILGYKPKKRSENSCLRTYTHNHNRDLISYDTPTKHKRAHTMGHAPMKESDMPTLGYTLKKTREMHILGNTL